MRALLITLFALVSLVQTQVFVTLDALAKEIERAPTHELCQTFGSQIMGLPNFVQLVQNSNDMFAKLLSKCLSVRVAKLRANASRAEWTELQTDLKNLNKALLKYKDQAEFKAILDVIKPIMQEVDDKVGGTWLVPFFLVLFGLVLIGIIAVAAFLIKSTTAST